MLQNKANKIMYAKSAAAVGVIFVVYLTWIWNCSLVSETKTIVVEPGASLGSVSKSLRDHDVLPNTWSFKLLAYLKGDSRNIKAGEYRVDKKSSQRRLLNTMVAGNVVKYPFVIIEGWSFKQVMGALGKADKLEYSLADKKPGEIMKLLGYAGVHPEGRFYPDTYFYSVGENDVSILKRAYESMKQVLWKEWEMRNPDVPLKNADEALTLASIIEKETGKASERPMIAGVFTNRLRKRMRLQTDPTVIYGMGDRFKGNIRRRDLTRDTAYNTYTRYGLPPTPIAMPGRKAIHAALHPATTEALYFVARGDGSHVFSDTLKKHNDAVVEYQLGGKVKRSAPANISAPSSGS